jgi:hypothetical protein
VARKGSIVYNVADSSEGGLEVPEGKVLAGVFAKDGSHVVMYSTTSTDGGQAWEKTLDGNSMSFEVRVRIRVRVRVSGQAWEKTLDGNSMSFEVRVRVRLKDDHDVTPFIF